MIFRFVLTWLLMTNGACYSETLSGYFSGGNHFYQEPASFLGWGSRSEGNMSAKSSGKGRGKGSSRVSTTTAGSKHSSKYGHRKTTVLDQLTSTQEESMSSIPVSTDVVEKVQTEPVILHGGTAVQYMPIAQMATANPFMFPYYIPQDTSRVVPGLQEWNQGVPNVVPPLQEWNQDAPKDSPSLQQWHQSAPNVAPSIPDWWRRSQRILPYDKRTRMYNPLLQMQQQVVPPQYVPPQSLVVQGPSHGILTQLNQTFDGPCLDEDGVCSPENVSPGLQLGKQEYRNLPQVPSPQQYLNENDFAEKIRTNDIPKMSDEEARHTLFVHPKLVSLMRAMDHSLLTYPSRFDYRLVPGWRQRQAFPSGFRVFRRK